MRRLALAVAALSLPLVIVGAPSEAQPATEAASHCVTTAEGNAVWWGRPFGAPALSKTEVNDRMHGDLGGSYAEWVGPGGGWVWQSFFYSVCPGAEWPGVPHKDWLALQFRSPDTNGPWKLQSPALGNNLCVPPSSYPSWAPFPSYAVGLCTG